MSKKTIKIGKVRVGGGHPVAIQSMTKTFTHNVKATVAQIKELEEAGCDIIRCAVPEEKDAKAIKEIKKHIHIPLVADIHFDHRLALMAIDSGADKIRINPGNIGGKERLKAVVSACKERRIPIRVGVNSGSLEKDILAKYGHPCAEALVESALRNVRLLEKLNFHEIVISIKSTSVPETIKAYRLLSLKTQYPLHIGITEAGISNQGMIKSAVGIGALLAEGIGDTMRVSLTGDPLEEVLVAKEILRSLEMIKGGVDIISCPTCGRCKVNVEKIAREVQERTKGLNKSVKIAIMGCVVNGPGEAKGSDIGFAGGDRVGLIFRKGRIIRKVSEKNAVKEILKEIKLEAK
jgi:(E)-4-hydroxy-3-methylbut-2-enyl-diphosphate synthase